MVSTFENTSALMDDWPDWRKKIECLTSKEASTRPYLGKLLKELENNDAFPNPDGT